MTLTRDEIAKSLATLTDSAGRDPLASGIIRALHLDGAEVSMVLEPKAGQSQQEMRALRQSILALLGDMRGLTGVHVAISEGAVPDLKATHADAPRAIDGVKHVLLVGSGKGGVGKSTVSANLALAFADLGLRVGLLDADIYGPSMPHMMGANGRPVALNDRIIPIAAHGLKTMSVGYLMAAGKALVWRGPLLVDALVQLLHKVAWGPLDILVIDLPPGTGDVQITLTQQTQIDGALIVTTPQDIALLDARRAIDMFDQTETPIFGIIENMSAHICPHCGGLDDIFGAGGAQAEAEAQGLPFLGSLPLSRRLRLAADEGTPLVRAEPTSAEAASFHGIAKLIWDTLSAAE